jgi:hypothetical protein
MTPYVDRLSTVANCLFLLTYDVPPLHMVPLRLFNGMASEVQDTYSLNDISPPSDHIRCVWCEIACNHLLLVYFGVPWQHILFETYYSFNIGLSHILRTKMVDTSEKDTCSLFQHQYICGVWTLDARMPGHTLYFFIFIAFTSELFTHIWSPFSHQSPTVMIIQKNTQS